MKKIILIALVLTGLLFAANPVSAQENITLEFPMPNIFTFIKKEGRNLYFEWKLPVYIGGEPYEGYTAVDMIVQTAWNTNHAIVFDGNWGVTHKDEDYLYGYAVLEIWQIGYGTITIIKTTNGPITLGF